MLENHVMKIRNGCTLEEMTKISMPVARLDPISKQMLPNFHYSSTRSSTHRSRQSSYRNENIKVVEPKVIPSTHYIENQFYAYSKAMITNKPLFSKMPHDIEQNYEKLKNRSATSSRFHTSRYPNMPLTKELSEKVEIFNSCYENENKKSKKIINCKSTIPSSSSRRFTKSSKLLENFHLWEKIKKQTDRSENNKAVSEISLKNKHRDASEISISQLPTRPISEIKHGRKKENQKKNTEFVSTIESISSAASPMAPVYGGNKMIPHSPNFVIYPYTKYGHLFE